MSDNHEQRIQQLERQLARLMSYEAQYVKYGIVNPTGDQALTNAYADFAGLTFTYTPLVPENLYLFVSFLVNQGAGTGACNAGDVLFLQVLYDGGVINFGSATELGVTATGAAGFESPSGFLIKTGVTAAAHTVKAQVKNITGARGQASVRSQFYYLRVAQ